MSGLTILIGQITNGAIGPFTAKIFQDKHIRLDKLHRNGRVGIVHLPMERERG